MKDRGRLSFAFPAAHAMPHRRNPLTKNEREITRIMDQFLFSVSAAAQMARDQLHALRIGKKLC